MSYQTLTKDNFAELLENNDTVIMDFWAEWCGPCRAFGPTFERVSEDYKDVLFAKCNTDEERELAGALKIQAIPTLMVFREKVLVFRESGALPEPALRELLDKVAELDMEQVHREVAEAEAAKSDEES